MTDSVRETPILDALIRAARMYATAQLTSVTYARRYHYKITALTGKQRGEKWLGFVKDALGEFVDDVEITKKGQEE